MFGHYDLKNLFRPPASAPKGGPNAFEAVRNRVSETLLKIKQAVGDGNDSPTYKAMAPRADAVNQSAGKLLTLLQNIENGNKNPTAPQTLALSQALQPLFAVWDRAAPTLTRDFAASKHTLGQVRTLVEPQEMRLFNALAASRKEHREGTAAHQQATHALTALAATAVNPTVRRRALRLGIASQVTTSTSDTLSPQSALDTALRVATAQLRQGPAAQALGRPRPQGIAAGPRAAAAEARGPAVAQHVPRARMQRVPQEFSIKRVEQVARGTITHPGVANYETIRLGDKVRLQPADYRHLGLTQAKYSILQSPSGASWVMTNTHLQGGSGKFRVGQSADGTDVAIKELRLGDKPGVSNTKQWRTRSTKPAEIIREAKLTVKLRGSLEKYTAQFDTPGNPDSLRGARTGTLPFNIHDIVEVPQAGVRPGAHISGKVHIIMTRDAGSLFDLTDNITTDSHKNQAGLALAAQGFTELGILHDIERHTHRDISLGNIFFNAKGQMRIMDFGMAEPTDVAGRAARSGVVGTLFTPEMTDMMGSSAARRRPASTAQDVFALGLCVAQLVAGPNVRNPFELSRLKGRQGSAEERSNALLLTQAFGRWKAAHAGMDGRVDPRLVRPYAPSFSDPYGFGTFFGGMARGNPRLFDLVLNQALQQDPKQRPKASDLARTARQLLPPANSRATASLVDAMGDIDRRLGTQSVMAEVQTLRAWEAETRGTRNAPRYQRGQVRPLP